jgi:hypothetical protein
MPTKKPKNDIEQNLRLDSVSKKPVWSPIANGAIGIERRYAPFSVVKIT